MTSAPAGRRGGGPRGGEIVPLAERVLYLRAFRLVAVGLVVAAWLAAAEPGWVPLREVGAPTGVYLSLSLLAEWVWRVRRRRGLLLLGSMLLVDGLFLAGLAYASGTLTSPVRYLVVLHVMAVTLLASYRTGVKLALWHSLLLFVVFYAQDVGLLRRVGSSPASPAGEFRQLAAFVAVYWLAALGTATFSAVNERELRRRRLDLEALARMARALEEAAGPRDVARVVVDSVAEAFSFDRAALLVASGGGLAVLASRGTAEPGGDPGVVDAVLRRAWASRDPLLVRRLDPVADPLLTSLFPEGRHLIVLPMLGEGQSRGALVVEHPARLGSRAESRVVSMLERFASHGEMALRNAALNEQMQRLAATDGLTGVANRRTFGTVLEKELERAGRTGAPVGLVLLDLDHFKQLNDRLGHQAGDRALQRVAEVLLRSARPYDTVARYGGEEFAVILPGTSPGQAASVAERFRRTVAAMDWTVPVTVSVGVASFPAHAADPVSLVKRADQALYRAKQGGRNRVVVSGGREGAPAASARPGG